MVYVRHNNSQSCLRYQSLHCNTRPFVQHYAYLIHNKQYTIDGGESKCMCCVYKCGHVVTCVDPWQAWTFWYVWTVHQRQGKTIQQNYYVSSTWMKTHEGQAKSHSRTRTVQCSTVLYNSSSRVFQLVMMGQHSTVNAKCAVRNVLVLFHKNKTQHKTSSATY